MIEIRKATGKDIKPIGQLFRDTIISINSKHYSEAQVKAWASGYNDWAKWERKVADQYFLVATEVSSICGFASLTPEGYIDYMFVHKAHQQKGIAKKLLAEIFEKAGEWQLKRLTADVSITALHFFKSKGFAVMRVQKVFYRKVYFTNYHVELFL